MYFRDVVCMMNEAFYRQVIEESPVGYALHKIICDDNGQPSDYVFLEVNAAFEKLTGLSRGNIIGNRVTEILPGTRTGKFDWVAFYGQVALTGEAQELEEFSEQLGRWYRINAYSPESHHFITYFTDITKEMGQLSEARITAQEISEASQFSQQVIDSAPSGIIVYDLDLRYQVWNPFMESITGLSAQDVIGRHPLEVFPHLREGSRLALLNRALGGATVSIADYRYIVPQVGVAGWSTDTMAPLLNSKGTICGVIATVRDVTERKLAEQALRDNEEKLRVTVMSVGDGFISTDKLGRVEIINTVAQELTGWSQEDAMGKPLAKVFNIINEYTREKCVDPVQKALETGQAVTLANHTILISKNGTERPIEDSAAPIMDEDGRVYGVVLVFRDFTDKKAHQDSIEYLSFHDPLTGLYNRRFYEEEVRRLNTERNLPISVIMGDVNGLKLVNDAFGHDKGDDLLRKAAQAIQSACRADDIVARWGGDEFIILLPKTGRDAAKQLVQRIQDRYSDEHVNAIQISISFGWDTRVSADEDIVTIMKNAEDNMYRSKTLESQSIRGNFIKTIINTLHEKNPREEQHSKRVSDLAMRLGTAMGLSDEMQGKLHGVGLLHDIGKIAIDQSILNKPGGLTQQEWSEMKRHPEIGYRIMSSSYEMQEFGEYILSHHEKWDGSGYPQGLAGEDIPTISRIITLADAYDAMTGQRTYKKALTEEETVAEIFKNAGTQFDPVIARVFVEEVLGRAWQ